MAFEPHSRSRAGVLTENFVTCIGRLSAELYRSDPDQLDLAVAELGRLYRLANHYRELGKRDPVEPGSCAHLCCGQPGQDSGA